VATATEAQVMVSILLGTLITTIAVILSTRIFPTINKAERVSLSKMLAMRTLLIYVSVCVVLSLMLVAPSRVYAANTFAISGTVTNNSGSPFANTTISVVDSNSQATIGTTTTDTNGNYSISVPAGTYNLTVTPPSQSGFSSVIELGEQITANTTIDFVLAATSNLVTVSGKITDSQGNGLNAVVYVGESQSRTGSDGSYSLQVSPGLYSLGISNIDQRPSPNVPPIYQINTLNNISLTENTILNSIVPSVSDTVHVVDANNNPVPNVTVGIGQNSSSQMNIGPFSATGVMNYENLPITDASGNAQFFVFPVNNGVSYSYNLIPPSNSGFIASIVPNITQINPTLILQTPIQVSGKITDQNNNGVLATISFSSNSGNGTSAFTDSTGSYSTLMPPDTYTISVMDHDLKPDPHTPQIYTITTINPVSLTANTVLNISIPSHALTIHVQDSNGNSLQGVNVSALENGNSAMQLASYPAIGTNSQGSGTTDSNGNVALRLLPTDQNSSYTIVASPPSASYGQQEVDNLQLTGDNTLTMILPNSVTVSGTVVDGNGVGVPAQLFFSSSGGNNTDSNGAFSIPLTAGTYTVGVSNVDPLVDPSAATRVPEFYTIQANQAVSIQNNLNLAITIPSVALTFHVQDPSGNSVANASIGLAHAPNIALPLGPFPASAVVNQIGISTDSNGNATARVFASAQDPFSFTISPPSGSQYSPVTIANITPTGDKTIVVSFQNPANNPPTVKPLSNATVNQGDTYTANGSFTDPDSTSWTATVDYGDGLGTQPLPLTGKTFNLSHPYSKAGNYTVTVKVTDNQGATGTATSTVTVIPTTTVTFDDRSGNTVLNGTYAGITWGANIWDVDGPLAADSTNSISFHSSTVTGEAFSFVTPQVLLSTQIVSNSNITAMVTLSCVGNPTVDAQVAPGAIATLTTYWQKPCTTVTVTSSNSWNANLDNLIYSSIPNSTPAPNQPPPPSNVLGYPIQGALLDTGDAGYMNGSKFTTSTAGGTVKSMSAFVGNVDTGSHNQYQMAIYTDTNGKPGTLVAKTATGILTPLSWNTLPITATLSANTIYWLMYNTNASTNTNYLNNLYFDTSTTGSAVWAKHAFGSWPTTFPSPTLDTTEFSIYVSFQ
jgi:hypothetical protein